MPEGVGGFFEFIKGRVVIPYDGSMWNFRHVIRHELVHVFMHSKIKRVFADHRMTFDRLPPLWFVEGLAEYWSIPNSSEDIQTQMVIRDATVSNYIVPVDNIERIFGSFLMYKEGQVILQFVGERFGEEKVLQLMENFWKSNSFEEVFKLTLGKNFNEFDDEWLYSLKKKYYPLLASSDQPSSASQSLVSEGFNSKPVYYRSDGENTDTAARKDIYFIGNRTGYTGIYRVSLKEQKPRPEIVVQGERTDEFEAFHLFQSKLDISRNGILAFITKSGENDVLHVYDVNKRKLINSYHFNDLVVLGSPSWSPDGKHIVFSSLDKSGTNDLYIWDTEKEMLTRLTNDVYDDRDPAWCPTSDKIVFSSDRTPYGAHGKNNLFIYDLTTNDILYLTYGDESYFSPAWSPDGRALMFTSDLGHARNVWMMKFDSSSAYPKEMRKLTHFTTAAFDPTWAESTLVFAAFEDFSFQIRTIENVYAVYDSSSTVKKLDFIPKEKPWQPSAYGGLSSEEKTLRYTGDYSLDIAQSQITTDPVFGTAGGAFLALSDLLGNEQYYFLIFNTAQTTSELLESFNIAISRISLAKRANHAYGVYRFSGYRYDETDPDLFYFEKAFGGYFALSYPLSTFRRIETSTSVTNSQKDATVDFFTGGLSTSDQARRALFLSNSISFIHDNALWGPSGPLDGDRLNLTLAYTTDIQYSHANYYSIIFDYRHYQRIAQRSALASRLWLFYNDGKEARRFFLGGSWDLRGYPRRALRGKKIWLTSNELRFPFLDQLQIRFPFGGMSFVGFRGALFFDAGGAWDDIYQETNGSFGAGLRLSLGGYLVLRYDVGKRIEHNFTQVQNDLFQQFFFGYDF